MFQFVKDIKDAIEKRRADARKEETIDLLSKIGALVRAHDRGEITKEQFESEREKIIRLF